jgi:hypothetical protein
VRRALRDDAIPERIAHMATLEQVLKLRPAVRASRWPWAVTAEPVGFCGMACKDWLEYSVLGHTLDAEGRENRQESRT